MKIEEIKNGEWYNVASLPEGAAEAGCPAEIGQRVQVLSTHSKSGGLIVAFPGWESLWDFRAENLETLEQKLRRQILGEVTAWHCVNNVTGRMLYTDSEEQMIQMRDANDGHWRITPLVPL